MKIDKGIAMLIVAVLFCGTYIWGIQYHPEPELAKQITVTGEGKVNLVPDQMNLELRMVAGAPDTTQAQEGMTVLLSGVLSLLKQYEVPTEQIKTQAFSVSPRYEWEENTRVLKGYTASQSLSVVLKGEGFAQKGSQIIAALPQAGNVEVVNTSLGLVDKKQGIEDAREEAFADAKKQAEHLAKIAGRSLGKVLEVRDVVVYGNPSPVYARNEAMDAKVSMLSDSSDLISVGEEQQFAQLKVVFELK